MPDIHKAGGLLIRDKKVLVSRTKGQELFIVPGGKLVPGETVEQALVREFFEEFRISIDASGFQFFATYTAQAAYSPDKTVQMDTYLITAWEGDIIPDNEIAEILWVDSAVSRTVKIGSILEFEVLPQLKEGGFIN